MAHLEKRYSHEISGGERQRVALARALAPQPIVLLLDESFSSLDAGLRIQIRAEVRDMLTTIQATAIFVTHDQEETLCMGDRLAVFNHGRLEKIAAPDEMFHGPKTRFVAEFIGKTDFLAGEVSSVGAQTEIGNWANDIAPKTSSGGELIVISRQFKEAMHN